MAINKPIWNVNLGGVLVRVPIGLYLFYAGYVKVLQLGTFVQSVKEFNILPENLATLYGVIIPHLEMGVGAFLVLGFCTTLASIVAACMLATYILALGIFPYVGNPYIFNKDLIVLGAVLSLLCTGSGAFSIDGFRQSG